MTQKVENRIFKKGSNTFFTSSIFFPRHVSQDVFDLYSFVRVADNFVDQNPTDADGFFRMKKIWFAAEKSQSFDLGRKSDDSTELRVVKNMLRVSRKHNFDREWVDIFLEAMEADIVPGLYVTIEDVQKYVYGSAEVVGLMMARIMNLDPESYHAAKMQGRAFQYINFIRDIAEDNELKRLYFPTNDLKKFGLKDLKEETSKANSDNFKKFIQFQIDRYREWQKEASAGYKYIPYRSRIAVKTAADMYAWTAQKIEADPFVIYERKIKPNKTRVFRTALSNIF